MASMNEVLQLTREYAMSRTVLRERVEALQAEIDALKRRRLPGIKSAVSTASERQALLREAVEESRELFVKPRTVIMFGIKVGIQKGKGELNWESSEQVVKLVRKQFPELADTLIKVVEKPAKSALSQLSMAELRKVGVTVIETGDQVIIKSTDSEIDRLVSALLKGEDTDPREAA